MDFSISLLCLSVLVLRNPKQTPLELLALLLFAAPEVVTLQKLLLLFVLGERSGIVLTQPDPGSITRLS